MAQPVYVTNNQSGGSPLFLLILPPLVPPGLGMVWTWDWLGRLHLHPMYQYAAVLAEIVVLFYAIGQFYRFVPPFVAACVTAVYMGATYGVAIEFLSHDATWACGIGAVTGVAGFYLGRAFANESHAERVAA